MKSDTFIVDRRIYELFQQGSHRQFTTRDLRDAYARHLEGMEFNSSDLRRYVYEHIRRMLRIGWVILDEKRQKRGQVYHLKPVPEDLQLEFIDHGFESSKSLSKPLPEPQQGVPPEQTDENVAEHLESILKEIRLDFLSSMGEAERYKQILNEMPRLKGQVEAEYLEARDRSSRLLGHLRAVEKTLKMILAAQ
jgi:hypothetical protein